MKDLTSLKQFAKGSKGGANIIGDFAVIYTRVSSKEQADNNLSLEIQKKFCIEYSERNKLKVKGYFGGTYESAKTDERNEFNRMLRFVKNQKEKINYILVYTLDRFSRSGGNAIYIASELKKLGIQIVSVTQPMDASTHTGTLQQNIQFIFSKYDNDLRKQKCVDGMKEKLRRGEWIGIPPIGYSMDRTHGTKEQRIIINEQGKLMKQAFMWKLEGETHFKIVERLKSLGLIIPHQRLTDAFRNVFYAGYVAHKMLDGDIVKGKHPALIPEKVFMQVNNTLKTDGFKQNKENDKLPLRHFIKCSICGTYFTGYLVRKKRKYYYKCNKAGCKCNRSVKIMHDKFMGFLSKYAIEKRAINPLKLQLEYMYKNVTENKTEIKKEITVKINGAKERLEKLERRFAFGEIGGEIYEKYAGEIRTELLKLDDEMEKAQAKLSNPSEAIDFALLLSHKLLNSWSFGELDQKIYMQSLYFPEGVQYDREKEDYRTENIFPIAEIISSLSEQIEKKEKVQNQPHVDFAPPVAREGVEPSTSGL